MNVAAAVLVAETLKLYVPRLVVLGEVTVSVVEVLVPGFRVSVEFAKLASQPLGGVIARAKLDAAQLDGSLFVTEIE